MSIKNVALTVHDLSLVSRYYQRVLGLDVITSDENSERLGVGENVLLELRQNRDARRRSAHDAGQRSDPTTGLANVEIAVADAAALAVIRSRIPKSELVADTSTGLSTRDPWGSPISFSLSSSIEQPT